VLLDLSLSADAWIEGRRVLDVTREAALVLGEVAHRLGDRLQLLGFASHTRNQVRVWEICGWREAWSAGRARLGGLRPQGYTRIGPALRHAAAGLAAVEARDRLLLLISDGKPTDYDRYEGAYGIADIRQAMREARAQRIRTHALAVAQEGRDYLPAMLGPGAWSLMSHPDQLLEALALAYGRLS
jgi:nitric oxide reductase NorD protein